MRVRTLVGWREESTEWPVPPEPEREARSLAGDRIQHEPGPGRRAERRQFRCPLASETLGQGIVAWRPEADRLPMSVGGREPNIPGSLGGPKDSRIDNAVSIEIGGHRPVAVPAELKTARDGGGKTAGEIPKPGPRSEDRQIVPAIPVVITRHRQVAFGSEPGRSGTGGRQQPVPRCGGRTEDRDVGPAVTVVIARHGNIALLTEDDDESLSGGPTDAPDPVLLSEGRALPFAPPIVVAGHGERPRSSELRGRGEVGGACRRKVPDPRARTKDGEIRFPVSIEVEPNRSILRRRRLSPACPGEDRENCPQDRQRPYRFQSDSTVPLGTWTWSWRRDEDYDATSCMKPDSAWFREG